MALLVGCVLAVCLALAAGACPHEESGLKPWSMKSSWPPGSVPSANSTVVIKAGMKIILDVSPTPCLASITVEKGGVLVWGDIDGLTVCTDYIYVEGRFQMGSEDCRFTKKAHIQLTGESNSVNYVRGFGRKFLGVGPDGVLEIHGAEKPAWTQLIQTVQAAKDTCGTVYTHNSSPYKNEKIVALHVTVFNLDGSVFDYTPFFTPIRGTTFPNFLRDIPDGKVIAMALFGDIRDTDKDVVATAIEEVGGQSSVFRNVMGSDFYAFITRKGASSSTAEEHVPQTKSTKVSTGYVTLDANDLQFAVESGSSWDNRNFRVLTRDVAYPRIKLNADVTAWIPGDKIVVASTDYNWRQAEVMTVKECSDCDVNELMLTEPFKYMHYGEVTYGVDERAEVGLLSRNILIEGIVGDNCIIHDDDDKKMCDIFGFDTFGGHIKVNRGFAAAHIQGAELYHLGQQKHVGTYPLHFHMCDDVAGNWFRYNSIHDSMTRCVTIHGSDSAEVSHNVCYKHRGHGFFLEDSVEQNNVFDSNLCIGTMNGMHLMSDRKREWCPGGYGQYCNALSSYWITHPNNAFINNVAAGSDGTGFWYLASPTPLSLSRERQKELKKVTRHHAYNSPVLAFGNNTAHSNAHNGLRMDNIISDGTVFHQGNTIPENGVRPTGNSHTPRDSDGNILISNMTRFTAYKQGRENVWAAAGIVHMDDFSLADAPNGFISKKVDEIPYIKLDNFLFVGETDNIGLPQAPYGRSIGARGGCTIQGLAFYKGLLYTYNSHFTKYAKKTFGETVCNAGAIGGKQEFKYQFHPANFVKGITFGFCDKTEGNYAFNGHLIDPEFQDKDGNRQVSFQDADGSVTGTPDTTVVPNNRFFTTDKCDYRFNWNWAVCPHGYAKVTFNGDGALTTLKEKYPLYMRRDDRPDDHFIISGEKGVNYLVLKNQSYTVYFKDTTPQFMRILGFNMKRGDHLRLGVCYPKDVDSFSVVVKNQRRKYNAKSVSSLQELEEDQTGGVYFWDKQRGILSVKLYSLRDRINLEPCPGLLCPSIEIIRKGGSKGIVNCFSDAYDGTYNRTVNFPQPVPTPKQCTKTSSKGYGAPVEENLFPLKTDKLTCPAPSRSTDGVKAQYIGCYQDHRRRRDLPYASLKLLTTLTVDICVERCYQRGYRYAGLQSSVFCFCGNSYGAHGTSTGCTASCRGDTYQICGGQFINSVYATGK